MNILVFSWRGPGHPLAGGAEQVMHEHMKGWIEAGHSVTLFTSNYKGAIREEIVDGIKILRFGIQYWGVHLLGAKYYFFGKHTKFDLVVDQFHGIPFFTPLYVRAPKIAVVQEVAREVWLKNDLPFPFDKIIGWIGYLGEPYVFKFYKNVPFITGSESAKKELVKVGIDSNKVNVIPHGVLLNLPKKLPRKQKTNTIVYLGALAKDKGVEDALKAFSILDKQGKFQFWLVGRSNPDYQKILEQLVSKLNFTNKIKFWGFVSQSKKFELLAKSHLMINPSLLEGWGLVNIEANATGVPVVGYSSAGLVDSISNGVSGILVKNNTPESLANAVMNILDDKKMYFKLQAGAIRWSKNFDWTNSRRMSTLLIKDIVS